MLKNSFFFSLIALFLISSLLRASELGQPSANVLKAAVVNAIGRYYYKETNRLELERRSLSEILQGLDKDSSLVSVESRDLNYVRGFIKKKSVQFYAAPNQAQVGVLKIEYFSKTTSKEVRQATIDLKRAGVERWILDLRGNMGGDLDSSLRFLEEFIPKGTVLGIVESRTGSKSYRSQNSNPFSLAPLVILVDGNTASCAEWVARSFKEMQNSPIVGTPTKGKRTVQQLIPLGKSWLILTVGTWRTFTEKENMNGPLNPDYYVEIPKVQMEKALSLVLK